MFVKEEIVRVKEEDIKSSSKPLLLLPPGFKPVTLNKDGLISGLQSDQSSLVKKEEKDWDDSTDLNSIVIKEEPLL